MINKYLIIHFTEDNGLQKWKIIKEDKANTKKYKQKLEIYWKKTRKIQSQVKPKYDID